MDFGSVFQWSWTNAMATTDRTVAHKCASPIGVCPFMACSNNARFALVVGGYSVISHHCPRCCRRLADASVSASIFPARHSAWAIFYSNPYNQNNPNNINHRQNINQRTFGCVQRSLLQFASPFVMIFISQSSTLVRLVFLIDFMTASFL